VTSVVTSEKHNLVRVSVQAPGSAAHNLPVLHLSLEAPFFWFLGLRVQFRSRSFLPSIALGQREQEKSKAYGQQGHQTKVAIHTHRYGPKVLEASPELYMPLGIKIPQSFGFLYLDEVSTSRVLHAYVQRGRWQGCPHYAPTLLSGLSRP
jgi:hypothetical protein